MRHLVVLGHNPGPFTGAGTNTYVLPGAVPTLVDTGVGHPDHLAALGDIVRAQTAGRLAQVLVTHAHPDHIGGAAAVRARWPRARFAKMPWPERDAPTGVTFDAIRDDELVTAGDQSLWAIHTPGHAPDHLCFFEPRSGTLFAGDLLVNGGTVVIPATHGGSVNAYLRSLRRLLELQPRRVLAGHGEPIEQPMALIREYIAHRLSRERQILEALAAGADTIDTIVDRVYPDLDPRLRGFAGESVLAHLVKLEEDGAVGREPVAADGTRWRLLTA